MQTFRFRSCFAVVVLVAKMSHSLRADDLPATQPSASVAAIESMQKELTALRAENVQLKKDLAAARGEVSATNEKLNQTSGKLAVTNQELTATTQQLSAKNQELAETSTKLQEAATRPTADSSDPGFRRSNLVNPFEIGMTTGEVKQICDDKGWTCGFRDMATANRGLIPGGARKSRATVTLPTGEKAVIDFQDGHVFRVAGTRSDPYPF